MIAYFFPPEANAGAHRPLRFVRNLPMLDWQPTVVTLATESYERYDLSLLQQVPEVEVIRVRNRDPWRAFQQWRAKRIEYTLSGASPEKTSKIRAAHQGSFRSSMREMIRNAETWIYHPDTDMGWIRPAVKVSLKYCDEKRPDMIWATAGPVSSFVIAQKLFQLTGVPYVLDFRD